MSHDPRGLAATSTAAAAEMPQIIEIGSDPPPPQPPATNWPAAIHSLLRGRYRWAVSLALVGLLAGAWIGYHAAPLKYRSSGMIRIRADVAPVLYPNDRNGMVPNFEGFVETQLGLLVDRHLIETALRDPDWLKAADPDTADDVAGFLDRLTIDHPEGSELVSVAFVDKDADVATAAVGALIRAYRRFYITGDADGENQRMAVLLDLQNKYDADLRSLNDRILSIANEFGSDSLAPVYDFRITQLHRLEADLLDLRLQVAALGGQAAQALPGSPAATQPAAPASPEQIAVADPQMRQLLNDAATARRDADVLSERLGPRHPTVLAKHNELARIQQDIDRLWAAYNSRSPSPDMAWRPLGQLAAREKAVESLYESAKHDAYDVGRKNLQIADLRQQADSIRQKLKETRQRIESLNVESAISNRVSVISYGDPPLRPYGDRRAAIAAASGFGGAALGFGSIVLLRLLDRRVRGLADARLALGADTPVLGILPDLSADHHDDPTRRLLAAHEIHCIRACLQSPAAAPDTDAAGGHVLAVTSAGPGDGKTSLAAALGYSFAHAGARTLLVDFDLVGRNLSTRFNRAVRPPIGRILRHLGLVTRDQVHDALRAAAASNEPVGQVLIARGLIGHADVLHALEIQTHQVVGLVDALAGTPLDDCIVGSGSDDLFLLPVGKGHAGHVAQLSPKAVQRLVAAARTAFDVVIIDTGPILGSLEARLVAAQADQTILAVSHGTQRAHVLQALTHLRSAGARLAGVVFNRATPVDLVHSTSVASLRSVAASRPASSSSSANGHGSHRDLLATAVVSTLNQHPAAAGVDADESLQ